MSFFFFLLLYVLCSSSACMCVFEEGGFVQERKHKVLGWSDWSLSFLTLYVKSIKRSTSPKKNKRQAEREQTERRHICAEKDFPFIFLLTVCFSHTLSLSLTKAAKGTKGHNITKRSKVGHFGIK